VPGSVSLGTPRWPAALASSYRTVITLQPNTVRADVASGLMKIVNRDHR
jgi:hypothetical protein